MSYSSCGGNKQQRRHTPACKRKEQERLAAQMDEFKGEVKVGKSFTEFNFDKQAEAIKANRESLKGHAKINRASWTLKKEAL